MFSRGRSATRAVVTSAGPVEGPCAQRSATTGEPDTGAIVVAFMRRWECIEPACSRVETLETSTLARGLACCLHFATDTPRQSWTHLLHHDKQP